MTPARRRPNNPVPTGLPRPGQGGLLSARAADPCLTVPVSSPMLTEPKATCVVIQRPAPDQGGLEGAAVIVIHSDAIQSP